MSCPQHMGDFIFPSHLGHLDTCTTAPPSVVMLPFSSGTLQSAQLALTPMLQISHRYVGINFLPNFSNRSITLFLGKN